MRASVPPILAMQHSSTKHRVALQPAEQQYDQTPALVEARAVLHYLGTTIIPNSTAIATLSLAETNFGSFDFRSWWMPEYVCKSRRLHGRAPTIRALAHG